MRRCFVDGIYYQGDIQGFDPTSIERVEIIKGPQSALYGRNTYAGAINYITQRPKLRHSVHFRPTARDRLSIGEKEIAGIGLRIDYHSKIDWGSGSVVAFFDL